MKPSIPSCRKWHEASHGGWGCPGCQALRGFGAGMVSFSAALGNAVRQVYLQKRPIVIPDFAVLNVSVCRDE